MLLNNQQITEEIRAKSKNTKIQMKAKSITIQNLWNAAKVFLRGEVYTNDIKLLETKMFQMNKLTLASKVTRERTSKIQNYEINHKDKSSKWNSDGKHWQR